MADHSIPDQIALEIMDTIEREKRINRDDLRMAVERVLQRTDRWQAPVMVKRGGVTWFNWAPGGIVAVDEPGAVDMTDNAILPRKDMSAYESARVIYPPIGRPEDTFPEGSEWTIEAAGARETFKLKRTAKPRK